MSSFPVTTSVLMNCSPLLFLSGLFVFFGYIWQCNQYEERENLLVVFFNNQTN